MNWLEVSVTVNPEAAEAVAEVLSRYAPQGVAFDLGDEPDAESPVTVKAYIAIDEEIETRRLQIKAALGHLSHIWDVIPDPVFREIPSQDWTAGWKERIPILHLGERVVIKPSWRTYEAGPDEVVLEMDPGMAFGTGLHPTTQLCVAALNDLVRPGMDILDLGTGTGILAMVAAKMGAGRVLAIDNDRDAVVAARRNVHANLLASTITVRYGTHGDVKEVYDLVAANILAPVIIAMAESGLTELIRPGGALIASGILDAQANEVADALQVGGLQVIDRRLQDEWVALIARRPPTA